MSGGDGEFPDTELFHQRDGNDTGSYFGVDFTQDAVAGSGLTMMAGIKTLDTSIIGAIIISGIVTALHNRLFDKKLPVFSAFSRDVLCGDYRLLVMIPVHG